MFRKPLPAEQRVLLSNVSWQQFEELLQELGLERTTRLTYHRGKLELMNPMAEHDRCNRLIESLILVLTSELSLKARSLSPLLLKQSELNCAVEPDSGYYLHTEAWMQEAFEVDLTRHAAPDLVVEIAITKATIDKLPIYALFGVPEVWRYVTQAGDDVLKGSLRIYQLQNDQYVESNLSQIFPFLPADRVLQFLEQSEAIGLAKALLVLRDWVKQNI